MPTSSSAISPQNFTKFGDLLRYLRERAELTQRELAIQVGYHYSYLSRIEKNERIPDTATLMARFVPALGLDNEPTWTVRLLELGSSASSGNIEPAAASVKPDSAPPPVAAPTILAPLTPLLGRKQELADLKKLLMQGNVRLVTIVGPLGVGKTSLATHLASQVGENFAHGAYLVELAPITTPDNVLAAIAQALGTPDASNTTLINTLRGREALILLDNFEHVIEAAPLIGQILRAAPGMKALVTSRESLRIAGEHEFPLMPLPLPEVRTNQQTDDSPPNLENFTQHAAIELFTQRARAVQPHFELTSENAPIVLEICRRLDGLPLAIELAAARMRMLTPQAMLTQFDRRFDWLGRGTRDKHSERSTLRGAVEWSYNLLSAPERLLLRRLTVFAGGCTLQSAEAICADTEIQANDVFHLLAQLVDKSLLVIDLTNENETRYRCLETIRQFGHEQLEIEQDWVQAKNQYLAYFASFAETVETHLNGSGQVEWSQRAELEHNNIRAALDWGLQPAASFENGLRLAAAISLLWIERSHLREGIARLKAYIPYATGPAHEQLRAKILYRLAALLSLISNFEEARLYCEQSIAISRANGNTRSLASALSYLGDILASMEQLPIARTALEESVHLLQQLGLPHQLDKALTALSSVLDQQGETEQAIATGTEALAIAEKVEDAWGISMALQNLGKIQRLHQNYGQAILAYQRSLDVAIHIGDRHGEGMILINLSFLHHLKGDFQQSKRCAEQAYSIFQILEDHVQFPLPMRLITYAVLRTDGNLVRARALALESLRGNRHMEHISGQLGSFAALAQCEISNGNFGKAASLASMILHEMKTRKLELLPTDLMAAQSALGQAQQKLTPAQLEEAREEGIRLGLSYNP